MHVFLSWSQEPSRTIAHALFRWLPEVLQQLKPWVSDASIGAGMRWDPELVKALEQANVGIVCVTPDNQHEPWLTFELGALSNRVGTSLVCPYLVGMGAASELLGGPINRFQAQIANEAGTFQLIKSLNDALGEGRLSDALLRKQFDRCWPELKTTLENLPRASKSEQRESPEVLADILETVRRLDRQMANSTIANYGPGPAGILSISDTASRLERDAYEQASRAGHKIQIFRPILPPDEEQKG